MADIEFHHVTKTYRLGSGRGLRETISQAFSGLVKRENKGATWLDATKDLSFQADRGEVLGLIGSNGAGKTTILKLISKVTYPSSGRIAVKGRISSLIELGAGFHPDLSGKENIYLNGSILGLKKAEIDARYDEIVDFSGLEKFIDTPLKRYSSGMYARLAFSVAAYVDPDILLVDEVLSVGDALFQEKSINKMKEFKKQGKTIIFVSHNMVAIQGICSSVIWLDHGTIREIGSTDGVIGKYMQNQYYEEKAINELEEGEEIYHYENKGISLPSMRLLEQSGEPLVSAAGGQPIVVEVEYAFSRPPTPLTLQIYFTDAQQFRIMGSKIVVDPENWNGKRLSTHGTILCYFGTTPYRPGLYNLNVDIYEGGDLVVRRKNLGSLAVRPDASISKYEDYNIYDVNCRWAINETFEGVINQPF